MNEDLTARLMWVINENIESGYKELINFESLTSAIRGKRGHVRKLFGEVFAQRPGINDLNLLCLVIGAMNYTAESVSPNHPYKSLCTSADMNKLVFDNYESIMQLCLTKNNNPTVPQRTMPFACNAPKLDGKVGVIDLGCSRGDCGLVWLTVNQFVREADRWFFPNWNQQVSDNDKENCWPIHRYLGVDVTIESDDRWLLSLWGFGDPRRPRLRDYYQRFRSKNSDQFKRVRCDVCDFEGYRQEVDSWFDDCDHLIITTSYMIYQLTPTERIQLCKSSMAIHDLFKSKTPEGECFWMNQGIDPTNLLSGRLSLNRIWLSILRFVEHKIEIEPVAEINGDLAEGWEKTPPIRPNLLIDLSAN